MGGREELGSRESDSYFLAEKKTGCGHCKGSVPQSTWPTGDFRPRDGHGCKPAETGTGPGEEVEKGGPGLLAGQEAGVEPVQNRICEVGLNSGTF